MALFDDLLAASALYIEAWETLGDGDQIGEAWALLKEEVSGITTLTSRERERLFRDAAIREAARRGDDYASVAERYGLSLSAISGIARAGGEHRRSRSAA